MVIAELTTVPNIGGVILLVVRNCGMSVAREVVVRFAPPLPDPDPATADQSILPYLKKRYENPIPVLAPGVVLSNIWLDYHDVVSPTSSTLPSRLDVTISSLAPDGHRYVEVFSLDAEVILNGTYVTSSSQPEQVAKESLKSQKKLAESLATLVQIANQARLNLVSPPTRTQARLSRPRR